MRECKVFQFTANFYKQSSFFNREWTWHDGHRDKFGHRERVAQLAKKWDIPYDKIWQTPTPDKLYVFETWGPTRELHEMIPMDYWFYKIDDLPGYQWGFNLFGTDDDMLVAKLSLPSWLLSEKLH